MIDVKLIRTKFLIPISEKIGVEKRIQDGYVLIEGNTIKEVGQYTQEIGKRILKENENNKNFSVIGANKNDNYSLDDIIQINGVGLPGFVKCHGHDHEPVITILHGKQNLWIITGSVDQGFQKDRLWHQFL